MNIEQFISNNHLFIIAKPNSSKTEIVSWDEKKKALRVNVKAKPENNEANVEITKFFTKLLKKKVSIKSGARSKEKLLKIE